jgi:hypothetical protein
MALIDGARGVYIASAPGTIRNAGTILATGFGAGAALTAGGLVVNGALNNSSARIQGYGGLALLGGSATNFGVISGVGDNFGVYGYAANITNGASGHAGALIEGYVGVSVTGLAPTVTNFGTIKGDGGTAVKSLSSTFTLAVEAKSVFTGAVLGGGGTLQLASGVGTISGLGSSLAAIVVSGSMATTTFQNFGTLSVASGATFTDTGAVTIGAGQKVRNFGALGIGGAVKNSGTLITGGGTLTISGAVTGAGAADIIGGALDLKAGFTQNVTFSGASGVLQLAQSQSYTGTITGFSLTGATSLDLADIGFVSASEATFSGTSASGVLTVTDGTHTAHITLKGNYLTSTFIASSDGHGGTIVIDPRARAAALASGPASPQGFIAAMAGLGSPAGAVTHAADAWAPREMTLAGPRTMIA